MTGKYSPQYFCVCCGAKLPGTRQELIARGAATIRGNGQILFHCPTHSAEDVQRAIRAVPLFDPASKYRKYATD